MTASRTCIFRADAAAPIGGGHVMRCLALADALAEMGWRCGFASRSKSVATVPALAAAPYERLELDCDENDEAAALAARWPDGCDLLVVDHYGLDATFERACRPWARRIMAIDDLADRSHDCDLLLDQTPHRIVSDYGGLIPKNCRTLFGPHYALLRPQFPEMRYAALARRRDRPFLERLFVCLGVTDSGGATLRVLDGIAESGLDVEVDVALGSGAPHLEAVCSKATQIPLPVHVHVDTDEIAALMAGADIAIGAGGISSWERCCLGLPTIMFVTAENQRKVAVALDAAGAVRLAGDAGPSTAANVAAGLAELARNAAGRRAMAAAAAALCDGLGATRVMMEAHADFVDRDGVLVRLRPTTMADGEIMLAWQRHPQTRKHFRNPAVPGVDEHFAWLTGKLRDPRSLLNIILRGDAPAGVLRFDRRGEEGEVAYEISILVAPEFQGRGVAEAALALGRLLLPEETFRAEVFPRNAASKALFRSAGFRESHGQFICVPRDSQIGGAP